LSDKKKIVFFTKSFNRTGSEILLLQLINNLSPAFDIEFFSLYKGDLYDELNPYVKKGFLLKSHKRDSFRDKLSSKLAFGFKLPFRLFSKRKHVWYINTIVLPGILQYAKKKNVKTILHCHELEPMFSVLNDSQKKLAIHYPALVIANSKASASIFQKNNREKAIEISYPFIDIANYKFDVEKYYVIRKELAIKEDEFVWLMCGTLDKNKNPELFIELAKIFSNLNKKAKFMWVGNNQDDPGYQAECVNSTKDLDNLKWITGRPASYRDYINACNGFILTSQFESFSIVTLEALAAGKPVVANNCVGVNEILRTDIGKVINPKNNINQFVIEMEKIMNHIADFNKEKGIARAEEFKKKTAIEKWNAILNNYIA
jgi:glycosyltransferase involved in cell wall biosynthesis